MQQRAALAQHTLTLHLSNTQYISKMKIQNKNDAKK
jgi:hypothetical protein